MAERRKRKHLSSMGSWDAKRAHVMRENPDYTPEQADKVLGMIKKQHPKAF